MLSKARPRGRALALATGLLVSLAVLPSARAGEAAPDLVPPPGHRSLVAYVTGTDRSPSAVWVAALDGSYPQRLGVGGEPLVSPSGLTVAAALFGATANSEQGPSLAIYSTVGEPVREYLSLTTATATPLAWSEDSRYLAVSFMPNALTNIARQSGLAVIDTQTGAVTTITHGQIYGASFAPDSSDRLVFARSPSTVLSAPTNLYTSMPDGSALRQITRDGRSLDPTWGPRYIAYDRERPRRSDASVFQIWLRLPSGGNARRLTDLPARPLVSGLVPLAFSGSGRRLLAEYEGQDTSEAWTVRVGSGRTHRITVRGQPVQGAGLSRDGSTLLIDEKGFEGPPSQGRVASIPFAGGRPRVLVAHGSQASWNR